jgi:hypothetical protein
MGSEPRTFDPLPTDVVSCWAAGGVKGVIANVAIDTYDDHRMAMAFSLVGSACWAGHNVVTARRA